MVTGDTKLEKQSFKFRPCCSTLLVSTECSSMRGGEGGAFKPGLKFVATSKFWPTNQSVGKLRGESWVNYKLREVCNSHCLFLHSGVVRQTDRLALPLGLFGDALIQCTVWKLDSRVCVLCCVAAPRLQFLLKRHDGRWSTHTQQVG